ncbi:MAG: acyltransferase family protein [Clostridia bacterium]|nr:acyltransferase family protein [Clostridia bacterium]
MRKQYDCIDAVKLLMALFVVAIHTNLFNGALFPTIRLAVPVFFILTGFFSFSKITAAPVAERKTVLWNIEKRYLQLYLFWFVVLLPFTIYVRKYYTYNWLDFISVFLRNLVWGSTFQASWYLMACILGLSVVYLLSKTKQILLISLSVIFYCLATYVSKYQLIIADNITWNNLYTSICHVTGTPYNNVCIAIMYIVIGKLIAEQKLKVINKACSALGFVVCYLGLQYEFISANNHLWFVYNCDCWFMLAPTAVFFVLFVLSIDIKIPNASIMRSISTIIYCTHLPILMVVSKMLSVLKISDTQKIYAFAITIVCSFILSFFIFRLEKKSKLKILKYSY